MDHVQLAMRPGREDEARAFHEGLLGISEVDKPPDLARRGRAWFARDDLKFHLGIEQDFSPARKAHGAFLVTDQPLAGCERVYESDPLGNRIARREPTPD